MSIQGKIAQIIDDTRLILNVGARDGVQLNQVFLIYQPGEEVFDPDTRETLGKFEIPKGKVVIENVQEKMAFAHTQLRPDNRGVEPKTLSEMMVEASTPTSRDHEALEIDPYSAKPLPVISPVKVGDCVRQIVESPV
jgi:hypothetical protein